MGHRSGVGLFKDQINGAAPVLVGFGARHRKDTEEEKTPAVGGGRGWVLETGWSEARRFDPARRWLAIGKDDAPPAPATIRQSSELR